MHKKSIKILARLIVSASLIGLLLYVVDADETFRILSEVQPGYLVVPVVLLFVQTVVSAYKWKLILAVENVNIDLIFLTRTYLVGQFISLFLPSGIGGDVYRIAQIKSKVSNFALRVSSVVFDRISGLYGLLLVAISGVALLVYSSLTLLLLGLVVLAPIAFLLLTASALSDKLLASRLRLFRTAGAILISQRKFIESNRIWAIVAISILFHGNIVLINYLYCHALSIDIRLIELWAIVPLVYLTDMIPVSINGIGIRDSAFVFFFGLLGYLPEHAFALALLVVAMRYAYGSLGGVLLLVSGLRRSDGTTDSMSR